MLPKCPLSKLEIKEPIRLTTSVGIGIEKIVESRLFEAENILQWLENSSLTDPINNQHIHSIDLALQARQAHHLSDGTQYNKRINAVRARLHTAPITRNPTIAGSAILQFSPPATGSAELWLHQEFALPSIITQIKRIKPATSMNSNINVLLLGDETHFKFRNILGHDVNTIGNDFFTLYSGVNRYAIWELAGQERFRVIVESFINNIDMLLYFGSEVKHYHQLIEKFGLTDNVIRALTVHQHNNHLNLHPINNETTMQTVSVRGDHYENCALMLLDLAVPQCVLLEEERVLVRREMVRRSSSCVFL